MDELGEWTVLRWFEQDCSESLTVTVSTVSSPPNLDYLHDFFDDDSEFFDWILVSLWILVVDLDLLSLCSQICSSFGVAAGKFL
ncbi:hypothetical protein Droror1_Dr00021122 [Drosera rotundifolia]